jgi:guanyl-specific ribonuclease Sa
MHTRSSLSGLGKLDPWLRLLVLAVLLGLAAYGSWQQQRGSRDDSPPDSQVETPSEETPAEPKTQRQRHHEEAAPPSSSPTSARTVIQQQTIRDQDGRIIFHGDIDVGPTLDRIRRDERLSFSHDGIVFQNRERRLPQKPTGYYREFVHPTPGERGPGPQRIVVGRGGESYYTPDHYRTFQRVDE